MSETEQQGVVCSGCGKHVPVSVPASECVDCGGLYVPATPARLACDRCGDEDATRVHNSEHSRLCDECIDVENRYNPECPDCSRRMIEADPASTPGPETYSCPDCHRELDQCMNCGSPSWLYENPETGDTECQRCGEVLAE
jgi:DNA-directed RNA polymerase subunit RPC12/RpoP